MFSLRLQRSLINFLGFSLLILLAACGTGPTTILTPTPTSTAIPGATSVSTDESIVQSSTSSIPRSLGGCSPLFFVSAGWPSLSLPLFLLI
jgi:hypothetical protein